jgi:hypothetical protein
MRAIRVIAVLLLLGLLAGAYLFRRFRREAFNEIFWPTVRASLEIDISAENQPYCHQISFPTAWLPDSRSGIVDDYSFRSGAGDGEILVAGFLFGEPPSPTKYRVDLTRAAPPVPAEDRAWDTAKILLWERTGILWRDAPATEPAKFDERVGQPSESPWAYAIKLDKVKFRGKVFQKTGESWSAAATRVSPDQAWIVLQSFTRPDKVFYDVYSVSSGTKVATLTGRMVGAAEPNIDRTGWLANGYFLIPTGPKFEGSVVCQFSGK